MEQENTWIEISQSALHNNCEVFRDLVGQKTKICGVVKANAYGHGVQGVVQTLLNSQNIDWWAVNSIDEALAVRQLDQKRPILVLTDIPYHQYQDLIDNKISLTISNKKSLEVFEQCHGVAKVHIKVDTGLGRLGVEFDQYREFLGGVIKNQHVELEGVMSHFANAEDVLIQDYALTQVKRFEQIRNITRKILSNNTKDIHSLIFHQAASAATMLFPQAHNDMVRIGISLYGLWASHETKLSVFQKYKKMFNLQPVLTWKSRIIHIKNMKRGDFIGYGCTYQLRRDSVIATIPVGYYEGYNRLLSNQADVLINGKRCAVVGRVSMHMITVDITDCYDEIDIGDVVTLIGKDMEQHIYVEDLSSICQTINYEFVTVLLSRIERFYK